MSHPYTSLPPNAYWRSGVSDVSPLEFTAIYKPRFAVSESMSIAAAGSCFAQHIGRHFKLRKYNFIDLEPPPPLMSPQSYEKFGFNLYSARYGNVYFIRQLLQLFWRANGIFSPSEDIWHSNGRFFDPFRPSIEPTGFASAEELLRDREYHLNAVRSLLSQTDLFVFTFGLTEAWVCRSDGAVLPTCPGTVAGRFDEGRHGFHNFSYNEILQDAETFIAFALQHNPTMKFLVTVSPVPLTATASGMHVLPASVYSKSVLRAVCGELYAKYPQLDYFPSYELVASHPMRAMFFEPNLRSVSPVGVEHVMNVFFSAHQSIAAETPLQEMPAAERKRVPKRKKLARKKRKAKARAGGSGNVICDEEILEVFGR